MIKKALHILLQFFGFFSKRKKDTPQGPPPPVYANIDNIATDADMLIRSTKFIKSNPGPQHEAKKKRKRKIRIQKQSRRINYLNSK